MISARRYRPTNTRFFTWILRHSYGAYIARRYRARGVGVELFETLKPPFILLGNHSTLLDPFLANYFTPHPVHWVASDGNMRTPFLRFLLIKLVGSIPKSKAIPDIETVSWIVEFIRKRKGVVGFYPEGQTTWDGTSLPAFGSTAKLIKLLKAPVACALSRGAYMTKPRWSYKRRKGEMEIEFSLLMTPQEIKEKSVEEIDAKLNAAIGHDDVAWAQKKGLKFSHPRRAECLELALFACPACGKLHSVKSRGAEVFCPACGFAAEYGEDGAFCLAKKGSAEKMTCGAAAPRPGEILFPTIKEWMAWQKKHLAFLIESDFAAEPGRTIFSDSCVRLLRGKRMEKMRALGRGELRLSAKGLSFVPQNGESVFFALADIEGPGVLKWNFFEFYVGALVYRARFKDRAASGYKYAAALELLIAGPGEKTAAPSDGAG